LNPPPLKDARVGSGGTNVPVDADDTSEVALECEAELVLLGTLRNMLPPAERGLTGG